MSLRTLGLCSPLFGLLIVGAGAGCSDAEKQSVVASISIASPVADSTITLDADRNSPVLFAVSNFTLNTPGSPACGVGCGNVHLLIDGEDCTPGDAVANNTGASSPLAAKFGSCASAVGAHTITLQLHNNDNTPLLDVNNKVIAATVNIKTILPNTGVPSIAITSPQAGETITLAADVNKSFPIAFTTENFTLAAPGTPTCGTGCGHVHVLVDGDACNSSTQTYNAEGSTSPINALFAFCAMPTGSHTVTLELHNDNHSIVSGGVVSTVTVTAQ